MPPARPVPNRSIALFPSVAPWLCGAKVLPLLELRLLPRGACLRLPRRLVITVKEIQPGLADFRPDRDMVAELKVLIALLRICGPAGESLAIGIAFRGEVYPVAHHGVREFVIGFFPGERPRKIAEHVSNVGGVKRAEARRLRAGRNAGEVIEIGGSVAGASAHAGPGARS